MPQPDVFLQQLKQNPEGIAFSDTMAAIDSAYEFTPTAFSNGELENAAGENNGSCKIFAFAAKHGLEVEQTLACFGDYYRKDVLEHPQGTSHQNIRNFMQTGWEGITFSGEALTPKSS
ncbi:MAG: HopJ type III effector protein [Thiolinea sp.]